MLIQYIEKFKTTDIQLILLISVKTTKKLKNIHSWFTLNHE
jgi:hypothetical protein